MERRIVALVWVALTLVLNADLVAADNVFPLPDGAAATSEPSRPREIQSGAAGDTAIRNISTPSVTAFLPESARAVGTAVIVCPGGGFRFLSWDNEGTKVAEWFQKQGVAAFVLKYRLKETAEDPEEYKKQLGAFLFTLLRYKDRDQSAETTKLINADMRDSSHLGVVDARQAVRFVRQNAARWGIKPDRIGMIGFSAGAIITRKVACDHDSTDRPDFAVHVYGPIVEPVTVPSDAPPLFIVCASDDPISEASGVRLYDAWRSAGRAAELQLFETGGHGFGMTARGLPIDHWPEMLKCWLEQHRLVPAQHK